MGIALLSVSNRPQSWAATGWQNGKFRSTLAVFATTGSSDRGRLSPLTPDGRNDGFVADFVVGMPGRFQANVSAGRLREHDAFLGSRASSAFFAGDARSSFARVGMLAPIGNGFSLQANYMTALSTVHAATDGLFAGFSTQRSEAAALSLSADNVLTRGSRFTLGVSQPLRVATGRASLNLPQQVLIRAPGDYSYLYEQNGVNLAPTGRELRYTVDFSQSVSDRASFSLFGMVISQPGHNAAAAMGLAGAVSAKVLF